METSFSLGNHTNSGCSYFHMYHLLPSHLYYISIFKFWKSIQYVLFLYDFDALHLYFFLYIFSR